MKFTNSMKVAGELAVRKMSDKARAFYNDTDQLVLYEHYDDEGVWDTINQLLYSSVFFSRIFLLVGIGVLVIVYILVRMYGKYLSPSFLLP